MKFAPLTTEDKPKFIPLDPGRYKFNVLLAEDAVSKAGNEMIKLKLECFQPDGRRATIFDYLMINADGTSRKIKGFCEAVGLQDKYQSGELSHWDCLHKSGELELAVESSEQYGDQNKVKFYVRLKPTSENLPKSAPATDDFPDEDVPF